MPAERRFRLDGRSPARPIPAIRLTISAPIIVEIPWRFNTDLPRAKAAEGGQCVSEEGRHSTDFEKYP